MHAPAEHARLCTAAARGHAARCPPSVRRSISAARPSPCMPDGSQTTRHLLIALLLSAWLPLDLCCRYIGLDRAARRFFVPGSPTFIAAKVRHRGSRSSCSVQEAAARGLPEEAKEQTVKAAAGASIPVECGLHARHSSVSMPTPAWVHQCCHLFNPQLSTASGVGGHRDFRAPARGWLLHFLHTRRGRRPARCSRQAAHRLLAHLFGGAVCVAGGAGEPGELLICCCRLSTYGALSASCLGGWSCSHAGVGLINLIQSANDQAHPVFTQQLLVFLPPPTSSWPHQVANFKLVPLHYQLLVVNLFTILGALRGSSNDVGACKWVWRAGHSLLPTKPNRALHPPCPFTRFVPRCRLTALPLPQTAASCRGRGPTTAGSRACSPSWLPSWAWTALPARDRQRRRQQAASVQRGWRQCSGRRRRAAPRPARSTTVN